MTDPTRSRFTFCLSLLAVLALVGSLAGTAGAASRRSSSRPSHNSSFENAKQVLEAQDAYKRAQSRFYAKDYAGAVLLLDEAIADLNRTITSSREARVRKSAGELLARAGSLRLASVAKRDA